jgi:hypothetical protein
VHTYTHTCFAGPNTHTITHRRTQTHMHACMHANTQARMHARKHMHACMHACMHANTHIFTHTYHTLYLHVPHVPRTRTTYHVPRTTYHVPHVPRTTHTTFTHTRTAHTILSSPHLHSLSRIGQNHMYTTYMTIYLVIFLPKTPYSNHIYRPLLFMCAFAPLVACRGATT